MMLPMLCEFATRFAAGLAGCQLLLDWRSVPTVFFRTISLVLLGLLVVSAVDAGWAIGPYTAPVVALIGGAVAAYFLSVSWGLGLPRLAIPLAAAIAAGMAVLLVASPHCADPGIRILGAAARLASAALLGSTLTAMLLGHHYLTAPAMSIDPLRRLVASIAGALVLRGVLAG